MKRLAALFVAVLALRLCHLRVVWVEEAYPAAAAIQMSEYGKLLYTDVFFDKPPATAYFYRLFSGLPGWPLRIAGACFVFACALAAFAAARRLWGSREAYAAAALTCFALSFDHPAAAIAIAPDLLMVLPHLLALWLVASGRFAWAGVACGVAFFANPKAALVTVVCVLWSRSPVLALTALGSSVLLLAPFWQGWYEQVWLWGRDYSRDSPFANPLLEGVKQSGSWIWFHLTLVVAAVHAARRERAWLLWIALNAVGVGLGLRFAPRYYFQLLPVVILPAARGLCLMSSRARALTLALLLIPLVRFGRLYPELALDAIAGRPPTTNQLALSNDSREAADIVKRSAQAGDTLFVWGYRPDIHVHVRMPLGAPFLDSQPVNGVLADRHLVSSKPSAMRGLRKLETKSTFVVDGLGLLNPRLAFDPGADYREVARTKASIVYRLTR
jgi:hypothetical protein